MKIKIEKLNFPIPIGGSISRYIVKYRSHWWNKWKYIMDNGNPQLFTNDYILKAFSKEINRRLKQ